MTTEELTKDDLDALADEAWALVERYDRRLLLDQPVSHRYLLKRFHFALGALADINHRDLTEECECPKELVARIREYGF